jgi:hypothetical protein
LIKKSTALIAAAFFVVQVALFAGAASAEIYSPNPLTRINTDGNNVIFKETCSFLCAVLSLYKSDVLDKLAKEDLIRVYAPILEDLKARFDFDNIDIGKKGWTRYYPFSIGTKKFVARIFLTKEAYFQPKVQVLSETVMENLGVTLQVLPDINEILDNCKIRPNKIYGSSLVDKSA